LGFPLASNSKHSRLKNCSHGFEKLLKTRQENPTTKNKNYTTDYHNKICPQGCNNTNIIFSNEEITLLNKGFKYNLHSKRNDWIKTLALEAETAINSLPELDRDHYRWQVANKINSLYTTKRKIDINNRKARSELNTMKLIKQN
jgi:hypothetical protein